MQKQVFPNSMETRLHRHQNDDLCQRHVSDADVLEPRGNDTPRTQFQQLLPRATEYKHMDDSLLKVQPPGDYGNGLLKQIFNDSDYVDDYRMERVEAQ